MSERVEELTALVLDGAATPDEEVELERLIAGAGERRAHLLFLEIEAALRARGPSQAEAVLARITHERAERVVRGVMRRVEPKRRRRVWRLWPLLALVSASALASFALVRVGGRRMDPPAPMTAPAPARLSPAVATPVPLPPPKVRIAPAPDPAPEVVLRYDFESELPDGFDVLIEGHRVTEPCGESRGCALGTISPYGGRSYMVAVERMPQLFRTAPGQVISFDFWVGADAQSLTVMTWSPERRQNYSITFDSFVPERWTHAEVQVADLVGKRGKDHLTDGARISNILVIAGRTGGKPLYVDNLAVTIYPSDAPPTALR
jgi:hypothetical protein